VLSIDCGVGFSNVRAWADGERIGRFRSDVSLESVDSSGYSSFFGLGFSVNSRGPRKLFLRLRRPIVRRGRKGPLRTNPVEFGGYAPLPTKSFRDVHKIIKRRCFGKTETWRRSLRKNLESIEERRGRPFITSGGGSRRRRFPKGYTKLTSLFN